MRFSPSGMSLQLRRGFSTKHCITNYYRCHEFLINPNFIRHLSNLSKALDNKLVARAYRTFDDEEDSIEDDLDLLTVLVIESASEHRHWFRKKYRSGRKKAVVFTDDLQQLQLNSEHQYR
jgi:hypothetical protein